MASLRITGVLLRQRFKGSDKINHSIECVFCKRLQTASGKRQRKSASSITPNRRKVVSETNDADVTTKCDQQTGQWEKLREGVSSTVAGIKSNVDTISKTLKSQMDTSVKNAARNRLELKMEGLSMADGPNESMLDQSVRKIHDNHIDETVTTNNSVNEERLTQNGTKADIDTKTDEHERIPEEAVLSNTEDGKMDEWVEKLLEIQEHTSSINIDQDHFHSYFVDNEASPGSKFDEVKPEAKLKEILGERDKQNAADQSKEKNNDTSGNPASSITTRLKESVTYFAKPKKPETKDNPREDASNNNELKEESDSKMEAETKDQSTITTQYDALLDDENKPPSSSSITDRIKESLVNISMTRKNGNSTAKVEKLQAKSKQQSGEIDNVADKTVMKKETNVKPKQASAKAAEEERSYVDMIWNLPHSLQMSLGLSKQDETTEQIAHSLIQSEFASESGLALKTTGLADSLVNARSGISKSKSLDHLCNHLKQYPQFRHLAVKHKVLPVLLQLREDESPDIVAKSNQALALIGYHQPPKGRGIRMMSIDGGGTRGLIAIESMMRLEEQCGRPIHEMFDLVIGSSTGALIAGIIFQLKAPVAECKKLYLHHSARLFSKSSWTSKVKNMAQFDVKIFEQVVRDVVGEKNLMEFAQDPSNAKIVITSTLTNVPRWQMYLFRSYNLPPGRISDYPGTCNVKAWEAVRASTSAPVYYREFQLGENIFMDGGCLANNPTALGIHECKLLWPDESFQCILSLGNGRFDPYLNKQMKDSSLWQIVKGLPSGFIESATDTEAIHQALKDTYDSDCYFRLCPYLSENYDLSEINPQKINEMLQETNTYINKNDAFMQRVISRLKQERLPNQKLYDFASRRKQTHNYFFF